MPTTNDLLSALNKNGSGLNLRELATTLVTAEISPRQAIETKRAEQAEVSISALGQVRSQFATLQTAVNALKQTPTLQVKSGSSLITPTITDRAALVEQKTQIEVQGLAQRQVLEFTGFSSAEAVVGEGTLSVEYGVWFDDAQTQFALNPDKATQTLTIAPGTTLAALAEQLDGLEGVAARVLDKGDGTFSLGVVGEPGAGQGLRFTAVEGAVAGLAAIDTTTTNATRTVQAAADAMLVVDGITLFRSSNSVDDIIPGMTLDLAGITSATSITVGRDKTTTRENLDFLVETLNATTTLLKNLTSRSLDGSEAGDLAGDSAMESLKSRLSAMISGPIAGYGSGSVFLSDFGVATQRNGSLVINTTTFEAKFSADPGSFDALFEDSLRATTVGVSIGGVASSRVEPGEYAFQRDALTGAASFAGKSLLGGVVTDGMQPYAAVSGAFFGLTITVPEDLTSTTIRYGRSFSTMLDRLADDALGGSGDIARRETQLSDQMVAAEERLAALDDKATVLENRYITRFAAMEQVITQMKSTGSYLTNLVDSWNKDS